MWSHDLTVSWLRLKVTLSRDEKVGGFWWTAYSTPGPTASVPSRPSGHSAGAIIPTARPPILQIQRQKIYAHLLLTQVTLLREAKLGLLTFMVLSCLRPWPKGQGGKVWAKGYHRGQNDRDREQCQGGESRRKTKSPGLIRGEIKSPSHLDAPPASVSAQCSCRPVSLPCSQTFRGSLLLPGSQVQGLHNPAPLKDHLPPLQVTLSLFLGCAGCSWGRSSLSLPWNTFQLGLQVPHSPHLPLLLLGPFRFLLNSDLAFGSPLHPYALPGHHL